MSFPVSPPNGSTTIINNVVYVYNSSKGTWSRISSGQPQLAEYTDITATGTSTFAAVVLDSATVNTGIFWANGDPWASTGGTTYGDSNVAAYLPTYSGALSVGDVSISGNLFVNGNTTTLNANNITINDTVIYIANNNPANTYDIGLVGHFTAGIYQHTGIVRDHTNNAWTFFSNATVEPTGNVITLTGAIYDAVKLGSMTAVNGQITGYHTGAIGANTANSGIFTSVTTTSGGQLTGYHTGAIGANTANSGVFTTLTASSGYQGAASGALNGTLGATTPNSVVATSVTTTSGGQVTGYITGPIGANTANSGSFTTITASSTVNLGSISNITITGGTNGQYLQTDGSGHLSWTTGTGGGGGSPGGSNAQVQFNDSGAFGGDSNFSFNKGTKILSVTTGGILAGSIGIWAGNSTITGVTLPSSAGATGPLLGPFNGTVGATTPNSIVATSVTTTSGGQLTGYITGPIGANTANTGVFTSVATTSGGNISGYLNGAIGANTANSGIFTSVTTTSGGQLTGYHTGAIGANTANTGVFTTLTATSGYQGAASGPINGTIGATTPNSGAFTTLTATSGYQGSVDGPFNGTIGATTPNSGAFTTLTTTSYVAVSGTGNFAGTLNAATVQGSTIGNSGSTLYGTLNSSSATQTNITAVGTLTGLTVDGTSTLGATTASTINAGTIGNSGTTLSGATISVTGDATVGGNLTITGNIIQNGTVTTLNANNLTINDTVIYIANNNPANTYDIGIVGHFTAGTYQHTGMIRDHSTNAWTFFSNVSSEPTGNVLTFDATTTYDAVKLGSMTAVNGQITGYHTGAIGANTANSGIFTSVTTTSGGQILGYINGPIGANTANTGAFTTVSVTSSTTAISNAGTNGVGNIGALGAGFNTLFALAANAANADLAELYESDLMYAPGTVVEFGGDHEITEAKANSKRIAGIISTKPGYLMNSEATGQFMLPVALQGRVPCKAIGPIRKGDMLISAGDGYAIASEDPKIGTVIGKAVQNLLGGSGVIEVVVGRI